MKNSLFLLFFLPTFLLSQQINNTGLDFSDPGNSISLNFIKERNAFFDVESIVRNSQNLMIYRFWNTSYCIEVVQSKDNVKGRVIMAVKNADKKGDFFRRSFEISKEQTNKIFEVVDQYNLQNFPTDSKIEGWQRGFDGNILSIESNINDNYTCKEYWTPAVQNVSEAKLIIEMMDILNKTISLKELKERFDRENRFTCYAYYGTAYSICKILTRKDKRKLKKDKNRH